MATANIKVIGALRKTAANLREQSSYQWGHMGACNCGNLAQVLTPFTKSEIHKWALASREGDWNDMLDAYCTDTNLPIDMVISAMLNEGFSTSDLKNLEYLSDHKVLKKCNVLYLNKNVKDDVILYLEAWASILEEELLSRISIEFDYSKELLPL